ncbi:MAG: DUF1697 domain-containing protein [Actinobacteria bacterium]|nr:MAG: DUF1697 domain-containing protein [Actinomycetota bacterium]
MTRRIALLRGINLGSRRRVEMAALRDVLAGLGYRDVRTFLQSGNVVFTSRASPGRLQRDLEKQLAAELGIDVQVLVRTRDELADVVERNPLGDVAHNPSRYLVSFLSAKLAAKLVRDLATVDVTPEQFVVSGREIYAWHPDGVQRSRLGKLLSEERLGVAATARNWNTVTKLLALADA